MEVSNLKKKLFICKFCNKRYPCGKSLGGHIRIHLSGNVNGNGNSADYIDEEEEETFVTDYNTCKKEQFELIDGSAADSIGGTGGGGVQSGYGLRENPKKTKRFVADSSALLIEKICKECGKGFPSLKALCGHMACHAKYNSFEDQSQTNEKLIKDQFFDTQSDDSETSLAPSKRKRSKRMRYKNIGVCSSLVNGCNSFSSASDIEHEQEEVAKCLMMLSKDSGFKGCFSSSSDNNSVVLETKSSSPPKLRISVKNGVSSCVYNGSSSNGKAGKQQEFVSVENGDYSDNSDSGYFKNGPKKAESEISYHGFTATNDFKKQKMEFESRYEYEFSPELGTRLSRFRRVKAELGKSLIDEDAYDDTDEVSLKYDSRKRVKNYDSNNPELLSNIASKSGKCRTLGANRTKHKRTNGCSDSLYETGENSIDTAYDPTPLPNHTKKVQSKNGKAPIKKSLSSNAEKRSSSKKGKEHQCPFCSRVFKSGQALGGHKRSHFIGGAEDRTVVINQEVSEMSMATLIDLNLPAPMEEDGNGYYIPSW